MNWVDLAEVAGSGFLMPGKIDIYTIQVFRGNAHFERFCKYYDRR